LAVDEDRFPACDMNEVELCLSPHQKYPDLAVSIDFPIRIGGKIDLLENEKGTRRNH
jgi:hypothetical protein